MWLYCTGARLTLISTLEVLRGTLPQPFSLRVRDGMLTIPRSLGNPYGRLVRTLIVLLEFGHQKLDARLPLHADLSLLSAGLAQTVRLGIEMLLLSLASVTLVLP